jgi:cyclic pyranopterin phosphate synthase
MGLLLPIVESGPPRAPRAQAPARRLIDSHGRTIRDLRLSITDRCNFRCVYCMDPDTPMLPQERLLTPAELVRVARLCVGLGVEKVRITGGEPTVHPALDSIVRDVAEIGGGLRDIAMTTNGALVDAERLARWRAAGLTRLTFSLDSLSPERFRAMTRTAVPPQRVVESIRLAKAAGFEPLKVNAVAVRGQNEDELPALAGLARELDIEMRFIEFMPLDASRRWDRECVVGADEIVSRIGGVFPLTPVGRSDASSTALRYRFADGAPGAIGIIAPVTRPFCGACSRLRITADGRVRPCLFSREGWDLRPLLRSGADDEAIKQFLLDATWSKQAGHGISTRAFAPPERTMSAIGG